MADRGWRPFSGVVHTAPARSDNLGRAVPFRLRCSRLCYGTFRIFMSLVDDDGHVGLCKTTCTCISRRRLSGLERRLNDRRTCVGLCMIDKCESIRQVFFRTQGFVSGHLSCEVIDWTTVYGGDNRTAFCVD